MHVLGCSSSHTSAGTPFFNIMWSLPPICSLKSVSKPGAEARSVPKKTVSSSPAERLFKKVSAVPTPYKTALCSGIGDMPGLAKTENAHDVFVRPEKQFALFGMQHDLRSAGGGVSFRTVGVGV